MYPHVLSFYLILSTLILFVASLSLFLFDSVWLMDWNLMYVFNTQAHLTLLIDKNGLLMASAVLIISTCVMKFSSTYMASEPFFNRFHALLILFISSMLLLIFLPNLLTALIGWDGLGLTSFLLVIFYSNPKSLSAGMITALTNRLGDALLLLSIAYLAMENNWNLTTIWNSQSLGPVPLLMIFAASTKSAQFPFSSWLPAAMAAPTPVSALVHSSTLVTAGVFILLRANQTLNQTPMWSMTLLTLGALTMVMAGASAITEPDLKKIIALSTLSQLGLMIFTLGLKLPSIALFHLIAHALFKALLFISAGTIIHFNSHSQDLRTTGPLESLPLTSSSLIIANLALCGTPFLAAFYSKDMIIELSTSLNINFTPLSLLFLATAFTSTYTARLLLSLLWAPRNHAPVSSFNEDQMFSSTPMLLLSSAAIIAGASINWLMITPISTPPLPNMLKSAPLMAALTGALLAITLPQLQWPSIQTPLMTQFHLTMWFLTPLSTQGMLTHLKYTNTLQASIDQGWQEIFGGQGMKTLGTQMFSLSMQPQNNIPTISLLSLVMVLIPTWWA